MTFCACAWAVNFQGQGGPSWATFVSRLQWELINDSLIAQGCKTSAPRGFTYWFWRSCRDLSSKFGRSGQSGNDATRAQGLILSLARPEGNPPQLDGSISLVKFERLFRLNFVNPRHAATLSGYLELTKDEKLGVKAKLWCLNLWLFTLALER